MSISVGPYEPWMRDQVASLFSAQYGVAAPAFAAHLDRFYDHPYQRHRAVRVVALSGDRVMGFQSFFFWPYSHRGRMIRAWQSGNSLVHPESRGQGVFQRLLAEVETYRETLGMEVLVGFPVKESYRSFIKNGWDNPFDLRWFVAPVNPIAGLMPETATIGRVFPVGGPAARRTVDAHDGARLTSDPDFTEWRSGYSSGQRYYAYEYRNGNDSVTFSLRAQRRRNVLRELIVGDIAPSRHDQELLRRAFRGLKRAAVQSLGVSLLSAAVNAKHPSFSEQAMSHYGFRSIDRGIHFITKTKGFAEPAPYPPEDWILFRSDVDTW